MASTGIIFHTPLQIWSKAKDTTVRSAFDHDKQIILREHPAYVVIDNVRGLHHYEPHVSLQGYSFRTICSDTRTFLVGRRN